MKLLKKFPKATRSHGKRVEGGAEPAAAAVQRRRSPSAAQLSAWQSGSGATNGRSRGASGEARPRRHARTLRDARALDSAARRGLARAAAALRLSAPPQPALHRPPRPPRHWCSARFSFRIVRLTTTISRGLGVLTQI